MPLAYLIVMEVKLSVPVMAYANVRPRATMMNIRPRYIHIYRLNSMKPRRTWRTLSVKAWEEFMVTSHRSVFSTGFP